jgi:hypothetical protein
VFDVTNDYQQFGPGKWLQPSEFAVRLVDQQAWTESMVRFASLSVAFVDTVILRHHP